MKELLEECRKHLNFRREQCTISTAEQRTLAKLEEQKRECDHDFKIFARGNTQVMYRCEKCEFIKVE